MKLLNKRVINTIKPNTIKKINEPNREFQMVVCYYFLKLLFYLLKKIKENVGNYIKACEILGLAPTDLFDPPDLVFSKNINLVINNIHVLAKKVQKMPNYQGPQMEKEDLSKTVNLFTSTLTNEDKSFLNESDDPPENPKEADLIDWVNSHLSKKNISIKNYTGLRSGVRLLELLEVFFILF